MSTPHIVLLGLGLFMLLFGRKFFWLLVGSLGFVIGWQLATQYFASQSETVHLLIAGGFGIVGAGLALLAQKVGVLLAGFLGGGLVLQGLLGSVGWYLPSIPWLPFVLGGIIGAFLFSKVFEWALVVVSSLVGALVVTRVLLPDHGLGSFLVVILAIVGIIVQSRRLLKKKGD